MSIINILHNYIFKRAFKKPFFVLPPDNLFNKRGNSAIALVAIMFLVVLLLLLILLGVSLEIAMIIIVGSLIFIISFMNIDMALIILIFSMLLSPEFTTGEVTGRSIKIRADDVFIIIIFFGWIAKMAINKELGLLRYTKLNRPIVVYMTICFVTSFVAIIENRVNIRTSFFYIMKYLEYFLLFFLVSNNLRSVSQAKKFIFYLLLTSAIVSVYAFSMIPGGGRVSGPFESAGGESNTFAGYLVLMMSVALGFLFNSRSLNVKIMLICSLSISSIAFLYTLSRSAWLSAFVAVAAFIVFNKQYRPLLIVLVMIVAIALPIFAPQAVRQRVQETFVPWKTYKVMGGSFGIDESASCRIDSWKIGFNRWVKKPVLGYGVPAGVVIDNQYTRVLNETGIVGFIAFLFLLGAVFKSAKDIYDSMEYDDFARSLTTGFLAGFMGLLFFSSAAATFIIIRIMEPFWFLVAIIITLPDLEQDSKGADLI